MNNEIKAKELTNVNLTKAINQSLLNNTDEVYQELLAQLRKASFLIPLQRNKIKVQNGEVEDNSTIQFGLIQHDGKLYLPVYTDWTNMENASPVNDGLVLSGMYLYDLVYKNYEGILINNKTKGIIIDKKMLLELINN